jgi:hypothetical protein
MTVTMPDIRLPGAIGAVQPFSEVRPFEPQEWDSRLAAESGGAWIQSTHYNEDKRLERWEEPVYLQSCNGEGVVLARAAALLTHPYEWGFHRRGLKSLSPLAKRLLPVLLCNNGPTIFAAEHTAALYHEFGKWVQAASLARGCIFSRFVPAYYQEAYAGNRSEIAAGLRELGFAVSPKATLVIDLDQSMDELFANLKKDARNKVRKAEKQGVEIVELGTDETSLQQLQQVMAETSRRNGLPALSQDQLKNSQWCRQHALGLMRAFVSLHEGHLVSSQMAVVFNEIVLLGGVSYTDYSRENNIYGNDLMQWHMIKWAKENGMQLLDFAGIAPQATSAKLKAIYEFKSKWGGRRLDYDEFLLDSGNIKSRAHSFLTHAVGSWLKGRMRS